MYKLLMIEDDAVEADVLREHARRYAEERGEEFSVTWYRSALELTGGEQPFDLIFMDIDMPGINGMEAAELLRTYDTETPLIFVTNLAQYAVRGYEVQAIDFMVKPVTYGSFRLRMNKAMRYVARGSQESLAVQVSREETRVISLSSIAAVEVTNHDLTYHLDGDEDLVVHGSLSAIAERLLAAGFVRVSKSCMVSMGHIRAFRGDAVTLRDGSQYPMSRSMKREAVGTITRDLGGSI